MSRHTGLLRGISCHEEDTSLVPAKACVRPDWSLARGLSTESVLGPWQKGPRSLQALQEVTEERRRKRKCLRKALGGR